MKEKYRYLTKNTLVFAISSFGTKFLSFFLVPLYTNVLSTEEYGFADIITTTATLMIYIFTINIADAVLRFALDRKERQSEILAYGVRVLLMGSLVLLIVLTLTWQSGLVNWDTPYFIFLFLFYLCTAFYQILTNYLRAVDAVMDVAKAGIISSLAMILGNIVFLLIIKIGLYGYLISMSLGPFIGTLYCVKKIRLPLGSYLKNVCDKATRNAMKIFCIPLIFNNIALWINTFLDKYFVIALCGVDRNGIYAVAYKIPTILSTFYMVFSQAWNLSAVKEFDEKDKEGFFSDTYAAYNTLLVCVCSGLILVNIPMAKLLFAKEFFEAWKFSSVLLMGTLFNGLTSFLGSIFIAVKNSRVIAATTLIAALINIVLNVLLIPIWDVQGAAIATAISYCVMWMVRLIASRRYINLKISVSKDITVYILLAIQILMEHTEKHCYIGQIIIFLIILFLYRKNVMKFLRQINIKKLISKFRG